MTQTIARDSMQYDVVIVGAGPAGLSAAIKLKQLAEAAGREISVCVVEKASEAGAHIVSGAVIDPISLSELIPDWRELGAPLTRSVTQDKVLFLTEQKAFNLPVTPNFNNHGNYIISLAQLVRWLAEQAEGLGVEIYPGFAAAEVLYHADGSVKGIATGNMGVGKNGEATDNFQPGMELWAQQTIFAEGCRGSLSKQIIERFKLDQNSQPQTYGLGIKEVWEVPSENHQPGLVVHTAGWPLDSKTYGGSFIYHLDDNKVAVGFVVGLDYQNPYLSPFEEFQRFKTHPEIRKTFAGGRRIAYGARALIEGGLQSLPKLSFAGGVLVGDAAGFMNMPRIKGTHTAMKSAMLAAEAVFPLLDNLEESGEPESGKEAAQYQQLFEQSWAYQELYAARNVRPSFKWGVYAGMLYTGIDQLLFKGKAPWTLRHHGKDNEQLKPAAQSTPIAYPKPDGVLTFDRLSSVFLANTAHDENQPDHLTLNNPQVMMDINHREYASPETRYCPAAVYEIVEEEGKPKLQINAANCVHCKTCDIKDPTQNIVWICPEGGSGPNYGAM
ncbi:electron transfer flavoprotein-ubiquinone oxidoreductase [Neisseria sp. ZJ106]|uniref:Electron transfer flavoprotein-ubiquinone oxidoreductase n=1 Tax=Neisseria lisongii TaxID=2912188 RepID=A0ABY7RHU2_9NEIS|nr:electron transfer flavoprotein-ubiquinone oxidoreductase [Neisseria lisongii]MCF7521619.1 electron transfer flavoprotein-ubiquinone oxidoreductase [Neisseria lisongii]WCL70854.1 electron transfer flavoprotein-ubiquinone oxidoreductase [Neisseria lisongii]